jgi:hypothetical protein
VTRVLTFDGDHGAQRFAFLRIALLNAGDGKGDRSRAAIRTEARLLEALDAVSDPAPTEKDPDHRVLKPEGGTVTLAQDDFDRLSAYVDTTPWVPRVARDAVDVQDWLSASVKVDQ